MLAALEPRLIDLENLSKPSALPQEVRKALVTLQYCLERS